MTNDNNCIGIEYVTFHCWFSLSTMRTDSSIHVSIYLNFFFYSEPVLFKNLFVGIIAKFFYSEPDLRQKNGSPYTTLIGSILYVADFLSLTVSWTFRIHSLL